MEKIDLLKQEYTQLQNATELSVTHKVTVWYNEKVEPSNQIDVSGGPVIAKYLAEWINNNWKLVLSDIKKNSFITLQTQLATLVEEAKGTLASLEADVLLAKPKVDELIAERVALVEMLTPLYTTASQAVTIEPEIPIVEESSVEG